MNLFSAATLLRKQPLLATEREKGVLDVSQVPSGILAHAPGYIAGFADPATGPCVLTRYPRGGLQFAGEIYVFGVSRIVGKRFTSANIVGRGSQRPMA